MVRRAGGPCCGHSRGPRASRPRLPRLAHALAMSAAGAALRRACCLLLCLVAGSLQLSIKEFVVPKLVEVGDDAELRCQYELGEGETDAALYVKWWWILDSSSSDDRKQIYQRIAGHDAESINHYNATKIDIKRNDTIVLLNVNPGDSGIYQCEVSNIKEERNNDTLIVYSKGTGPILNYTLIESQTENEEDQLLIECEAEGVAPLPDLTITLQGEIVNTSKTVEDTDQDGFYKIYANTTVSASNSEVIAIQCDLVYPSLELPPYVDSETYIPAGALPLTTEAPDDESEPETTPEPLQNSSDDGIRLHCPWMLLTAAVVVTHLRGLL